MNEAGDDAMDDAVDTAEASVRETYDRIADHFATTREYPWPEVETFVDETLDSVDGADGSSPLAIDLGCGNGRHTQLLAERGVEVVGADVSRQLLCAGIRRASERGFDATWVCADAATLPFTADTFDIGVYVATLHHLRPRSTRVESLDELERVLSPGGRALVSAWSTDHDRFDADAGFDTTIDWTLPGGVRVPRYYHIYDPGEFRTDLDRSSLSTRSVSVSSGNCYAIVEPSG